MNRDLLVLFAALSAGVAGCAATDSADTSTQDSTGNVQSGLSAKDRPEVLLEKTPGAAEAETSVVPAATQNIIFCRGANFSGACFELPLNSSNTVCSSVVDTDPGFRSFSSETAERWWAYPARHCTGTPVLVQANEAANLTVYSWRKT